MVPELQCSIVSHSLAGCHWLTVAGVQPSSSSWGSAWWSGLASSGSRRQLSSTNNYADIAGQPVQYTALSHSSVHSFIDKSEFLNFRYWRFVLICLSVASLVMKGNISSYREYMAVAGTVQLNIQGGIFIN